MAVLEIVKVGDDILRQPTQTVKRFNENLHTLLDDMAQTLYDAKGAGLAAPQIGISKKVVVIDIGEGLIELVNPRIVSMSGEQVDEEGCLSIPEDFAEVRRAKYVTVEAQDRNGVLFTIEGDDYLARAFQHEIDHLNGILFIDHVEEKKLTKQVRAKRKGGK